MTALTTDVHPSAVRANALAVELAATEETALRATRARRRLLAVGSIGAAVALVAAPAVAPWEGDGEWIAALVADPGSGQAGALLYWAGFLLTVSTVLALASMVRRRATRIGLVGATLAVLGTAAQPGLLITDFFQLALGETLPMKQALAVDDRVGEYVALAPMYMVGFLGGAVGMGLLTLAAWRAGWLRGFVPLLFVAGYVLVAALPPSKGPSLVAWSVLALFHVTVAVRVLRATDEEWAAGLPLPRQG